MGKFFCFNNNVTNLYNTNFISKFEINAFEINVGKGMRHFNPLEDYRFFHHWFSGVADNVISAQSGRLINLTHDSTSVNCRYMYIINRLKHGLFNIVLVSLNRYWDL
jgi:hypothetical protein